MSCFKRRSKEPNSPRIKSYRSVHESKSIRIFETLHFTVLVYISTDHKLLKGRKLYITRQRPRGIANNRFRERLRLSTSYSCFVPAMNYLVITVHANTFYKQSPTRRPTRSACLSAGLIKEPTAAFLCSQRQYDCNSSLLTKIELHGALHLQQPATFHITQQIFFTS